MPRSSVQTESVLISPARPLLDKVKEILYSNTNTRAIVQQYEPPRNHRPKAKRLIPRLTIKVRDLILKIDRHGMKIAFIFYVSLWLYQLDTQGAFPLDELLS